MADEQLVIETVRPGPSPLVRLQGELDAASCERLAECLAGLLDAGALEIEVDVARLRFVDSPGLRVLVGVHQRLLPGSALRLAGVPPPVRRVLEITGLDQQFVLV